MWGQFLPRPSVALVVILALESPTLKRYLSSFYLIRLHWLHVRVPLKSNFYTKLTNLVQKFKIFD